MAEKKTSIVSVHGSSELPQVVVLEWEKSFVCYSCVAL